MYHVLKDMTDKQTDKQEYRQTEIVKQKDLSIFFVILFLISVFNQLTNTGKLARIFMEGSRRRGRFSIVAWRDLEQCI